MVTNTTQPPHALVSLPKSKQFPRLLMYKPRYKASAP